MRSAERDDALPGEDVQRLVDRAVDARRRRDGAERAGRDDRELDRRHPRLGLGRGDARAQRARARRAASAAGSGAPPRSGRRASRTRAARGSARSGPARCASRCSSSSRFSCRSSIVTCCETMRPSPERPAIASCTLSTGTRTVIDALPSSPVATDDDDDVAAERAREVESILRGARDGVGVGDLDRQRRADALCAVGPALSAALAGSELAPARGRIERVRCRALRGGRLVDEGGGLSDRLRAVGAREPEHASAREARVPRRRARRRAARGGPGSASSTMERWRGCSRGDLRGRGCAARRVPTGRDARSSWIRSGDDVMVSHPLFELRQALG